MEPEDLNTRTPEYLTPYMYGIAATAILIRIGMACATHSTGEDFLITLRYAENLAAGHGFVYNLGERVLGSTTPLYTLLLALAACLHLDASLMGKACNIIADGVTCLLIVRLLAHRTIGMPVAGLFAALLYAVSSTPISISISGMETALVTCAGMAAVLAYVEARSRALFLWAGALFLLRIDTLALSALLIGAYCLRARHVPWRDLGLALLLVLPWLVFATVYFGSPIPTSLIAKLTVYRGAIGASRADILAAFADQFASGWFQRGVTLLFFVGSARAVRHPEWYLTAPLLWLLLYYGTMLTSRVPAFGWYFLPPWPLVIALAALGGKGLIDLAAHRLPPPAKARLHSVWIPTLAVFGLFGLAHLRAVRSEIAQAQALEDQVRRPLGLWLRVYARPDERTLLEPIGTIGYYSRRPILDMIGLVSPQVLPSYRAANPLADIVRRFRPDWLCLRPNEAGRLAQADPSALQREYTFARDFHAPGKRPAFLLFHLRQDSPSGITQ